MGWFDGDDSDDEEEQSKPQLPSANAVEEEEDPLDAYMKSLGDTTATTASSSSAAKKPGRLDLENEDEATSHWKVDDEGVTKITSADQSEVDEDGFVKSSTVAKRALQQTFHKAGQGMPGDDDDDVNVNDTKQSKNVDIQLQQVDHTHMQYQPFDKVFWNPIKSESQQQQEQEQQIHRDWRQEHGITLHDAHHHPLQNPLAPIYDFLELKDVFDEALLQKITSLQYTHPTPVQAQTLAYALHGQDCLITSPTGSGKTLAYVWPMVTHVCAQHHLQANETGPIGLILVPTRELAQQVHLQVKLMLEPLGGSSLTIIGGMGKYPLTQHLRQKGGVEIVVATPGRLLDVISTRQQQQSAGSKKKLQGLSLERCTFVVLDESDRLLHMGFAPQVTQILEQIRPDRQTLMLSATMSKRIETVAQQWLHGNSGNNKRGIGAQDLQQKYVRIAIGRTGQSSSHVQQHVLVVPNDEAKLSWLQQMLPTLAAVGRTLVFVATKEGCERLKTDLLPSLETTQVQCVTLHGDKHQSDRTAALKQFVKQKQTITNGNDNNNKSHVVLIATDVAARGLDIPQVATVVNYDPPKNLDTWVHRIGRAGRLSRGDVQQEGSAYTLLRKPHDADIGHVLLGALTREGRPVPEELRYLAALSRQQRGGNASQHQNNQNQQTRNRWNKAGLGTSDHNNYYQAPSHNAPPPPQPQQQFDPPKKKSRWS